MKKEKMIGEFVRVKIADQIRTGVIIAAYDTGHCDLMVFVPGETGLHAEAVQNVRAPQFVAHAAFLSGWLTKSDSRAIALSGRPYFVLASDGDEALAIPEQESTREEVSAGWVCDDHGLFHFRVAPEYSDRYVVNVDLSQDGLLEITIASPFKINDRNVLGQRGGRKGVDYLGFAQREAQTLAHRNNIPVQHVVILVPSCTIAEQEQAASEGFCLIARDQIIGDMNIPLDPGRMAARNHAIALRMKVIDIAQYADRVTSELVNETFREGYKVAESGSVPSLPTLRNPAMKEDIRKAAVAGDHLSDDAALE